MNAVTPERISLYYREGASDKVYQAAIEPAGDRFVVNFAYGRRGSTLTTGTKTSAPVEYDTAQKVFAKLVSEKKSKGYTEGADGTPYQHTDKQSSGILPQLLNPVEEAEVKLLLCDDNYCAQEKFDGRHLLVRKQKECVEGINKKGLVIGLPQTLADDLSTMHGSFILDGESVGDDYHVFDLLEAHGEDLRSLPYQKRFSKLAGLLLFARSEYVHIKPVKIAFKDWQKTELWERLRQENREGIVFKRLDAPYVPGKPNRGGSQLKFKFVATLSAIITKVNIQRSVEVSLFNGRSLASCGNVTIPANHEVPNVGVILEIRYLYAFKESGILYQPVYLGLRDDVDPSECRVQQLKYKAE
jgi:bifunctional non-homologous end joining protein LigD